MRKDRLPANKEIIKNLRLLISKYPTKNLEELINEFVVEKYHWMFYEESVDTLAYMKKKMKELENIKSKTPSNINVLCVDRLEELVNIFPDQRFGQICDNYFFGQYSSPIRWLMSTEKYLEET